MSLGLRTLSLGILLAISSSLLAESVYVRDELHVGLREGPSNATTPIGTVSTGMKLDVKARQDGFINVSTAKGKVGWLKESYTTNEPPARLLLDNMREKYSAMEEELKQLRASQEDTASGTKALEDKLAASEQNKERMEKQLSNTRDELAALKSQKDKSTEWTLAIIVAVLIVLGSFVLGLFLGTQRYKRKVAERFGGMVV